MSEDDEVSQSGSSSGSSPSSPVERDPNTLENSDDDSASDGEASTKEGSHSESSSDDEGQEEGRRRTESGSSSVSSHGNSNSRSEGEGDAGSGSSRSGSRSRSASPSGSAQSRSQSGSDHSENDSGSNDVNDIKQLWENDPDFYGVRRSHRQRETDSKPPKLHPEIDKSKKSPKKIVSKKRKLSSDDDSSDEEVARTTRKRGAQVVSYKENESDDDLMTEEDESHDAEKENGKSDEPEEQFETIERIMDHRMGRKGATGSGTTIYAVEERGDPNIAGPDDEPAEEERQFLIKWTGWSHLHNTWESLETIQEVKAKGLKKLDNYCKKEDELARWKYRANPEDVEYYECQLELQQDLAKSYTKAERVIAEHKGTDGLPEFFVKWECLPYSDATWESGALIRKRNPEVIDEFKRRDASNRTPSSSSKSFRSRPKFAQIKSQPSYMGKEGLGLELRDYQLDGLNWLVHSWCKDNSVILADEMGLGKTIQTICYLSYLFETHNLYGPYLIVVPLSTMTAWQKEFSQWAPQINVVTYLGDISSREIIREYEWYFKSRRIKFNAVLTTYEIVLKDKDFLGSLSWAVLMVDEAHRLKNGDSLLYKTLIEFDTNHRLLITGTPLQNSLKELWSLLHFIMPRKFDDWESFEKEHDHAATKGYTRLHKQLEPFIIRRVKKDVEKSLPAKVEQILRVEMTMLQKQYYKWILTKNYTALRKGVKGSISSFVNVVMELKKCCNHAQLVKPIENPLGDNLTTLIKGSGKLMLLDKLLVRLKETGHRVLIFSQMVRMLDIIAEYLQLRRFSFQRLDGSIKGDLRKQALEHFNAEGSTDFCFLLSTRAGGLGINLATADTVIIFDSDWNPQNDLQAQARAHRIGQKNQVNIYRLVTKSSVEEDIVERAKRKMVLDHLVIQRMDTTGRTVLDKGSKTGTPFNKEELTAILKFGAEELFKEDENDGEDNCDIDEILRRAETHEDNAERPGDELLSAFKVASFAVNEEENYEPLDDRTGGAAKKEWESIIPEDIRKRIDDEEKEKEMADLYLPPRSSRAAAAMRAEEDADKKVASPGKKSRKLKRKRDESEESGSDGEGGRPKKRGRPQKLGREAVKGFNDNQIRKFLRSFKRFPKPLLRIETIAKDAGLSDKSLPELKKLGETLYQRCISSMAEAKANPVPPSTPIKEEPAGADPAAAGSTADGENPSQDSTPVPGAKKPQKPREKGPFFKIAGVAVNARTLSNCLEELEPLGEALPKDETSRKNWKFEYRAKVAAYDVDWGAEEDTRLLLGVWDHGMGSWQLIRDSDPVLVEKVFVEGDKKPQLKHIHTRAEYLIKVLKKNNVVIKPPPKAGRKKREKKGAGGIAKEGDENSVPVGSLLLGAEAAKALAESSASAPDKNDVKAKSKKGRKKKDAGPMHFTAHAEPTALTVLGDLDPVIFNECKEKMRPVKKALKQLDKSDPSLPESEQIKQTKNCLLQIGDQIEVCLSTITDELLLRQSKSNLWYFVSKFTEYDPLKLYRLYKRAARKKEEKKSEKKKSKEKEGKSKEGSKSGGSEKKPDKEPKEKKHHKTKKSKDKDRDKDRDTDKERERDRDTDKERERDRDKDKERGEKDGHRNRGRDRDRDREERDRHRFSDHSHERDRDRKSWGGHSRFDRDRGDHRPQIPAGAAIAPPLVSGSGPSGGGDPRVRDRLSVNNSSAGSEYNRSPPDHRMNDPRDRDRGDRDRDRDYDRAPGDPRSYNSRHNFERGASNRPDRASSSSSGWSDRGPPRGGRPPSWASGAPPPSKNRVWTPSSSSHFSGPPRSRENALPTPTPPVPAPYYSGRT